MTKMAYTFDINQLHILNTLVFDASIDYSDLKLELKNDSVEYPIGRMSDWNTNFWKCFTQKILFRWNYNQNNGMDSIIKFNGIKSISIKIFEGFDIFKDNHFIQNIELNIERNTEEL